MRNFLGCQKNPPSRLPARITEARGEKEEDREAPRFPAVRNLSECRARGHEPHAESDMGGHACRDSEDGTDGDERDGTGFAHGRGDTGEGDDRRENRCERGETVVGAEIEEREGDLLELFVFHHYQSPKRCMYISYNCYISILPFDHDTAESGNTRTTYMLEIAGSDDKAV